MTEPKFAPAPWSYEVHELSEGYSAIVYDARGHRIGGLDHLDEATARLIAAAPELYAMTELLERCVVYEIKKAARDGDDEGARLKSLTLAVVRAALAKARGEP